MTASKYHSVYLDTSKAHEWRSVYGYLHVLLPFDGNYLRIHVLVSKIIKITNTEGKQF